MKNLNEIESPLNSEQEAVKYFYECGGCDHYHPLGFIGDCRDDKNRYNFDDFGNLVNYFNEGFREFTFEIVPEDFEEKSGPA